MADSSIPVSFIHLRTHSAYSLSEGALPIKLLGKLAVEHKMPALAITDTGNLFGALEFADAMKDKGVQPIVGCTLMVDAGDGPEGPQRTSNGLELSRLALLAKDEPGYRNLMKLSSKAYLGAPDGELPHVTLDDITRHNAGLICLTGGPGGLINRPLVDNQFALAQKRAQRLLEIFGDRLYVELQRHGMDEERAAEAGLIDLAYDMGLPLVATNEPYFATADDFAAHDALICIAEGEVIANDDRRRLTPDHHFKSQAEMVSLFADLPEAVENTVEIARRCSWFPHGIDPILPKFTSGEDARDEAEELRVQAREGLADRLDALGVAEGFTREDYEKKLEYELDVINSMDFPGYFLIVADFIKWAKDARHSGGAGAWLRRRLGGRLGADHHRSRPAALQPCVRALPQPRARVDAGLRHRLLPGPARRGDRLCPAEIRRRPGGADHHLRKAAGARGVPRRGPGAADALWPGGPALQADSQQSGQSGHPAAGHRRRTAPSGRTPLRRDDCRHAGDRAEAGGAVPARLDPCGRCGDRRPAAGRTGAALPRPALADAGHSVQHEAG